MRFILGVELAIPVIERLALLQEELAAPIAEAQGAVRWTPIEQLRVNLMIFPDLDAGVQQRVQDLIAEVAGQYTAFEFTTHGTIGDKIPDQARLVTTQSAHPTLQEMRDRIHDQAEAVGFAADPRPWQALTLIGRLATPHGQSVDFDALFAPYRETPWGTTICRELVLYRSEIIGRDERIRVVKRFALGTGR